ncbi:MAG: cytochrome c-type biogenesis protein [Pseudomonadota bacterium]|nr:cytochrome c-type biogenesis protein [Pseudomonadota bacterium]
MIVRVVLLLSLIAPAALAVEPDEILTDLTMEKRARQISKELRCLVCQNQSIDDSDAPLARDLRLLVRERLLAGDSDEETVSFIVDRYGDFVLLRPPFKTSTLILWIGPLLILISGIFGVVLWHRRRPAPDVIETAAPLTTQEQDQLEKALSRERDK